MEESFLKEENKLYKNVEHSRVSTDFYNRVYEYVKFLEEDTLFKTIIANDYKKRVKHFNENKKTLPKQRIDEDELRYFVRKMEHAGSGETQFLDNYYFRIKTDIFDPLNWYYSENKETAESDIMLNEYKKKFSLLNTIKTKINNPTHLPSIDLYDLYIKLFPNWKIMLANFHILLAKEIEIRISENKKKEVIKEEILTPIKCFYDSKKSLLIINGVGHSISRKSEKPYVHYILKHIFDNDPSEEYFYNEMNDANIFGDPKEWHVYYKALNTLKARLDKEIGISDFFEKISTGKTGSVKISSKYL